MSEGITTNQIEGSVFQLLGPFRVEWDTLGLDGNVEGSHGAELAVIPEGAVIFFAFTVLVEVWNGASGALGVRVYKQDFSDYENLCISGVGDSSLSAVGLLGNGQFDQLAGICNRFVADRAPVVLTCQNFNIGTAGASDVYVVAVLPRS